MMEGERKSADEMIEFYSKLCDAYPIYSIEDGLEEDDWDGLILNFKDVDKEKTKKNFPQDVNEQLWGAVSAVFLSWNSKRAKTYRKINHIPDHWGTAVNIQSMVFGNMGDSSATGVCFTRNPSTGENAFYGEYLVNAQGEDVVAGIRTPQPLTIAEKEFNQTDLPSMEENMPILYKELCDVRDKLENHYKDMQDMEFTIQDGKLWMLQTRNGKRTGKAALKIAVEMSNDGLISREEAVKRIEPGALDQLLHPTLDPDADRQIFGKGLPASPGAACGKVAFSAQDAESMVAKGEKVILVRIETSPEDIGGMHAAEGILTTRGGMTSHAAVVARGMGRPCVSGAGQMNVDYKARTLSGSGVIIHGGDIITIDGSKGEVLLGEVRTIQPELTGDFGVLMSWVDEIRLLKVRANAETPEDAKTAVKF
jgi:pyruvate,orthophosphate dikinase